MISTTVAIVVTVVWGTACFMVGLVLGAQYVRKTYEKLMKDAGFK